MQYNKFSEKRNGSIKAVGRQLPINRVQRRPDPGKAILISAVCLVIAAFQYCYLRYAYPNDTPPDSFARVQAVTERKDDPMFSWHNITPSEDLIYHRCFGAYECARLEVPMDWHRQNDGVSKVAVVIIRLPAKVSVSVPRYGGAVLVNPGGPGGSGVSQVLRNGRATQVIVDSELDPTSTKLDSTLHKYHDIIGFDPRGISRTTPSIQCFPNSLAREAWGMQNEALGLLGSSEDSFWRNWYRSKALGEGCSNAHGHLASDVGEPIGEHVNSSPVARDMLEIVERHAEWVEKQGRLAQRIHDVTLGRDNTQSIARRTSWSKGKEKILYWGNSYGTILGQTFASMFPDRVGRMVLDGVCDSHDYYFGPWFSNLQDTDKIIDKFFQYCFEAGPEGCSFYALDGPGAIKVAYNDLLLDIFKRPRAVASSRTRGPDVITWSDVKSMVRLGMYQPLIFMPMVADLLTDVAVGNGSLFADFKSVEHTPSCPSTDCKAAGPYSQECNDTPEGSEDATMAILCTDGEGLGEVDESKFQQHWHALQNQSTVLGDWWAMNSLACVGWKTKAKWRFPGPFTAQTSSPMLFIGNTLDPVTPLDNAKRMSANFPGSALLQQDSEGHTSWSSPSLCTARAARAYFQTGALPDPGTICKADRRPFQDPQSHVAILSHVDQVLADALKVMQETYMNLRLNSRVGL